MLLLKETVDSSNDKVNYYPCDKLIKITVYNCKKIDIHFSTHVVEISYSYSIYTKNIRNIYNCIHNMIDNCDDMDMDEFIKKIRNA